MGCLSVECIIYLQLFLGWIILCLSTLALCLVPESALFYGLSHDWNNVENIVIYGFMVLGEVSMFFVLLVVATMVMSFGRQIPAGVGLIHLIVDPALAPVVAVPMLTIRGLSSSQTLFRCHHEQKLTTMGLLTNTTPTLQPSRDCQDQLVKHLLSPNTTAGDVMMLDLGKGGVHGDVMNSWITSLQCLLLLPVLLRTLRYRWKMAWQPFIQANLYLSLQALDVALLESFLLEADLESLEHHLSAINIISVVTISITATTICVGCTAVLSPPIYLGNHITNSYLRVLLTMGTMVCDLPFLVLRVLILYRGFSSINCGDFMLMTIKNTVAVVFLLGFGIKHMYCFEKLRYHSLVRQETDTVHMCYHEGPPQETEDYV